LGYHSYGQQQSPSAFDVSLIEILIIFVNFFNHTNDF
jgi:hypothetical protein